MSFVYYQKLKHIDRCEREPKTKESESVRPHCEWSETEVQRDREKEKEIKPYHTFLRSSVVLWYRAVSQAHACVANIFAVVLHIIFDWEYTVRNRWRWRRRHNSLAISFACRERKRRYANSFFRLASYCCCRCFWFLVMIFFGIIVSMCRCIRHWPDSAHSISHSLCLCFSRVHCASFDTIRHDSAILHSTHN